MSHRDLEAGIHRREDHFHGSGVNRIDLYLIITRKFSSLIYPSLMRSVGHLVFGLAG